MPIGCIIVLHECRQKVRMKKTLPLLLIFLTSIFNIAIAQSVAHNRCTAFGKGMNLSNWLEAYWQSNFPTSDGYTYQDLAKMKEAGIQSIRLPIGFASATDTVAPYTVDLNHPLFTRVDSVISWCDALGLNLIIDNHHNWDIFNQNWRNKIDRFSHMWSVVSNRYKTLDPNRYTFELLNEPAFGIAIDTLNIVFNHAIDSIRQHTILHSIIVSPNFSSNGAAFANLIPLADTNLIYTWHSYDPYQFTHQGFSWASPQVPAGQSFPGAFDQGLYTAWSTVINWRNTYNKPVFLGEFGTGVFGDDVSRCNWINVFGSKIDSFDMPWFYWDWRWDFSLFNSNTISADSVVPCFRHGLHLYGDTLLSSLQAINDYHSSISLYPNPATSYTSINLTTTDINAATVVIYDISGKKIFADRFYRQTVIPVPFTSGLYIAEIATENGVLRKKLIVQ